MLAVTGSVFISQFGKSIHYVGQTAKDTSNSFCSFTSFWMSFGLILSCLAVSMIVRNKFQFFSAMTVSFKQDGLAIRFNKFLRCTNITS